MRRAKLQTRATQQRRAQRTAVVAAADNRVAAGFAAAALAAAVLINAPVARADLVSGWRSPCRKWQAAEAVLRLAVQQSLGRRVQRGSDAAAGRQQE